MAPETAAVPATTAMTAAAAASGATRPGQRRPGLAWVPGPGVRARRRAQKVMLRRRLRSPCRMTSATVSGRAWRAASSASRRSSSFRSGTGLPPGQLLAYRCGRFPQVGREGCPAARQPGLDRPGAYTGLGRDLFHRQINQVIEHQRAALLGRHSAQRLDEGNAIGAGPGGAIGPGRQHHQPDTLLGTPPPGSGDPPGRNPDPRLSAPAHVDPAAVDPGPDERLLHGVLGLGPIAGHGIELAHQPWEAAGVEAGELLTIHGASVFAALPASRAV